MEYRFSKDFEVSALNYYMSHGQIPDEINSVLKKVICHELVNML
jgi:hypothetical protein